MSNSIHDFEAWVYDLLSHTPRSIEPDVMMRFGPKKRCYGKLWADCLGGFAGDFRSGTFATWSAINPQHMSHSERLAHEARVAQSKAERDREQDENRRYFATKDGNELAERFWHEHSQASPTAA